MKTFRTVLFWMHLAAGVVAGAVILIMSVTGVALTYEKQMLEWADRRAWTASASAPAASGELRRDRLAPEALLAHVAAAQLGPAPIGVTLRADASAPATVLLEGNKSLLVHPYTGAIIGEAPAALRSFFRTMTSWHRYIAMEGESRATGKSITGASNLLFLFVVLSGMYIWVPRIWTRVQFRNVLWFRGGLSGKARDFNWHNAIGIWSAVPLAIVILGAVPISYPWASNLVYRLAGDTPPAPAAAAARPAATEPAAKPVYVVDGLDASLAVAQAQVPAWRTITTRFATSPTAPIVMTIDEGYGGQPQLRTTLTVDRATAAVAKRETFGDLSAGRRARSWLRFAHTGEFYGLVGQTIAGLATFGGVVLVVTGITLAIRRLAAWIKRRRTAAPAVDPPIAA